MANPESQRPSSYINTNQGTYPQFPGANATEAYFQLPPQHPGEVRRAVPQPAHIDPIDYSKMTLQEAVQRGIVKQTLPMPMPDINTIQPGARENPEDLPGLPRKEKEGWTRGQKLLAGVLAFMGVSTAAGVGGTAYILNQASGGSDKETNAPYNPGNDGANYEAPNADYSNIDIATFPNSEFKNLPYGVQIDKCASSYTEAFNKGALQKFLTANKASNGYNMKGGIGTGSINDPAQEILNRLTVKEYITYSETNINKAKNMASCVYETDSPQYDSLISKIADGNNAPPTITDDFGSTPVFRQGSFAGHEANGIPTRVIKQLDPIADKFINVVLQQKTSNTNTSISEVVVVGSVDSSSNSFVRDLSTWRP